MWRAFFLLALAPLPAAAQPMSTSPAPDAVSVTIYRDPNRAGAQPMQLQWLNGYALITETRSVTIPAGEGDIRFEGVAGGIIPESAIVAGLPDGVVEKNQDAYLLSPASLLDRSLGRRVHLRRTSLATGEVREQEAVIRSGADGAVVLQTEDGFEALRCTGIPETIVYPSIPAGLSSKPTLSVRTRSDRERAATVTLSYLATGFDWQANYIATLAPTGDRLDLFAWVTLANGDETNFRRANTQTVAGRPNRIEVNPPVRPASPPLNLQCWPSGTTSDIPLQQQYDGSGPYPPPPPPPPPPMAVMAASEESIVVTGSRVMKAQQEELGDLKLYRIPEPVTVAAQSQKQVAMLEKEGVKVDVVWRSDVIGYGAGRVPAVMTLRTRNRTDRGLGLPLPSGGISLFADYRGRPVLLGQSSLEDKAVGEEVEVDFSTSTSVHPVLEQVMRDGKAVGWRLVVANAGPAPVRYEAKLADVDGESVGFSQPVQRKDCRWLWSVTVPANGTAAVEWKVKG